MLPATTSACSQTAISKAARASKWSASGSQASLRTDKEVRFFLLSRGAPFNVEGGGVSVSLPTAKKTTSTLAKAGWAATLLTASSPSTQYRLSWGTCVAFPKDMACDFQSFSTLRCKHPSRGPCSRLASEANSDALTEIFADQRNASLIFGNRTGSSNKLSIVVWE